MVVGGTALGLHFAKDDYPVKAWDPTTLAAGLPAPPAVAVSPEFWKPAHGGMAPLIQSPWGETFRPAIRSVFGYKLYDPYSTGPDNSREFFDWQYERATEVVYGRSLTAPQLYAAKQAGLRPITARARMQILNLAAVTLFVLVLIFLRELFLWHRVRRLSRLARGLLMAAVVAPPLGAILALDFIPMLGSNVVTSLFDTIHVIQWLLLRISTLLPDNLLAVTTAAAVPVVMMYLLLERLFGKTELLGPVRAVSLWSAEA